MLIVEIISLLFSLLFLYAAASKLFDYANFKIQLAKSPVLTDYAGILAWLVPALEIGITSMLLFKRSLVLGLYASFALMMLFTSYIIVILNFSDSIPCSCGGILQSMTWRQHLVFNICFVVLALIGIFIQNIPKQNKAI